MTRGRHARAIVWPVLAGAILIAPRPAQAGQGTLQVVGAAQAVSGEIPLGAHLQPIEPDFGLKWEAPTARLGAVQLEMRGTERGGKAHLGRMYAAARDAKIGGWKWTFEAGDAYYSPFIGSYKFANLTTHRAAMFIHDVRGHAGDGCGERARLEWEQHVAHQDAARDLCTAGVVDDRQLSATDGTK